MKKAKRGPKPKPDGELKVPVKIWVKKKYFTKAKKDAEEIERKYSSETS